MLVGKRDPTDRRKYIREFRIYYAGILGQWENMNNSEMLL